jgi:two-component system chemotaxis response regulator CheB
MVALDKLEQLRPDVVTMDIEMPLMDGIATVRALRKNYPRLPVIMFSTLTERGAAATLDALAAGANDYVTKPTNSLRLTDSLDDIASTLLPKVKALAAAARPRVIARPAVRAVVSSRQTRVDVVVIGASTGGPDALARVMGELPADLSVPIVVVQHMPKLFTKLFAERLNRTSQLQVMEAGDRTALRRGQVLVAPGDYHVELEREGPNVVSRLTSDPPENYCRPAVDVLFRSAAATYGPGVLGVVLTGMGNDGRRGAERIRSAGGRVIVQDEDTSVVWGMPGAVAANGQADEIVPLGNIASLIRKTLLSTTASGASAR